MTDQESIKKNRTQVVIMIVALPLMVLFGAYSLIFLAQQEDAAGHHQFRRVC